MSFFADNPLLTAILFYKTGPLKDVFTGIFCNVHRWAIFHAGRPFWKFIDINHTCSFCCRNRYAKIYSFMDVTNPAAAPADPQVTPDDPYIFVSKHSTSMRIGLCHECDVRFLGGCIKLTLHPHQKRRKVESAE